MNCIFKKLSLFVVAFTISTATIQPGVSLAQTSGMGSDGNTRLLWRAVDQSIALWDINANLVNFASIAYGPYAGWTPIAMTAGINNYSYVLWNYVNGASAIWLVDPNLRMVGGTVVGPYAGWTAESLSTGTSSTNIRLLWKRTDGMLAVWNMDQNLNLLASVGYGPYYGYNPAPVGQAIYRRPASSDTRRSMPAAVTHTDAAHRAVQLMSQHSATKTFPALPKL